MSQAPLSGNYANTSASTSTSTARSARTGSGAYPRGSRDSSAHPACIIGQSIVVAEEEAAARHRDEFAAD
jgi:hypothetical protein